jgi:hypothetical protein
MSLAFAALTGCGTEPRLGPRYLFSGIATATDSLTGRASSCQLLGNFALDSFARVSWVARDTRAYFSREIVGPSQSHLVRDTLIVGLSITGDYPDSQTVRLILGAPISDTLLAPVGSTDPASGIGGWTCRPILLFATDSQLQGAGYRTLPPPIGDWHFLPSLPID